jgi:ribonuclease P protein component
MLPKKNRADRKAVEKIFKEGRFFNSPNLTFKFILKPNSSKTQISFVAPKTVSKLAVKRNFLRRLGYNVLGKYFNQFPSGTSGVFVFKKYQDNASVIDNEIKNILSKIN